MRKGGRWHPPETHRMSVVVVVLVKAHVEERLYQASRQAIVSPLEGGATEVSVRHVIAPRIAGKQT